MKLKIAGIVKKVERRETTTADKGDVETGIVTIVNEDGPYKIVLYGPDGIVENARVDTEVTISISPSNRTL